jgi:polar amino acid transport system substrate-binding protein
MMRNYVVTILSLTLLIISPLSLAVKLNIVTLQYPPYAYKEGEQVKGVAVEIVTEVLNRMELPFTITILPWARALHQIEKGKADAIFTLFKNPEREVFADYSDQILISQIVSLYVKKNAIIKFSGDLKQLERYSFGLVRKVSYGDIFDRALKDKTLTNVVRSNHAEQSFKMLFSNRVDIVAINKYGALDILRKSNRLKDVKALKPDLQNIPSYIAFSKKKNLSNIRDKFDDTLRQMKRDGTYEQLILTALSK